MQTAHAREALRGAQQRNEPDVHRAGFLQPVDGTRTGKRNLADLFKAAGGNLASPELVPLQTPIAVFRCPSAGLPDHQYDVSTDGWHVMARVPGSYLGCATGTQIRQGTGSPVLLGYPLADGVLYGTDKDEKQPTTEIKHIIDGTSKTILIGEAAHDVQAQEEIGSRTENILGDHKDHWYIGSDDIDTSSSDISEALGSTGVLPNLHRSPQKYNCFDFSPGSAECQALQLSFGSEHPGVVQVVLCDGSVQTINEGIDLLAWRAWGTRNGEESVR